MRIENVLKNKTVKNAGWMIGEKIIQMIFSFFVGIITARYLGPSNKGLIDYASAFTTFSYSLCTLGIGSVIVKNFVDYPEEEGCTIGTTLVLRGISSFLSVLIIVGVVSLVDSGENLTILVVMLCSLGVIFQIFDTISYWFQNRLQSKYASFASLTAYIIVAAYKIVLLILGKGVVWFAVSSSIDYIVIALFLFVAYKKNKGPKFTFSFKKAKQLLKSSYHFILSGLMVSIYNGTDKFMLKQMIDEASVGYYTTATTLCNAWCFILSAIISSAVPTILRLHNSNTVLYEKRNRQLYAIVFYLSVIVSLMFTVFANLIISILYGAAYLPAVDSLRIITWYTAFSYLGVARNSWMVCEGKQKFLKYLYVVAAVGNIVLNFIFIPLWGAAGAALASLATQILTAIVLPLCMKDLRPNAKLMLEAIMLRNIFSGKEKNNTEELSQ